jgi:septal ring factor EnvC (AmiA/AmiB activator)
MKKTIFILSGILCAIVIVLINKAALPKWAKTVSPLLIRNDEGGDGHYNTERSNNLGIHQGIDLSVKKGQPIFAPFKGTITRKAIPYANDTKWSGCVLADNEGNEVKFFYLIPSKIGKQVKRGEQIGIAQAISEKYGSPVTDHVHLEFRKNGVLADPTSYIFTV